MVGAWVYTLNKKIAKEEGIIMTLDSILNSVNIKEKIYELNPEYTTIRYIDKNEYEHDVYKYVEPAFNEAKVSYINQAEGKGQAKFVLFSAPGATGKTALAKHICYSKGGVYWDLPNNKVAEYSFQGAISKAVGYAKMGDFIQSIQEGKNFLVIDAFDEAEAGSGRSGIEFFLRDLNTVAENSNSICGILLARTESAIFIKNYFINNNISFKHYEVGHFAEYNAKAYIRNKFERKGVQITDIINQCIDEQFREIHRIFHNGDAESFLGYAPVLDALAAAYDNEKNTLNLLKETINGEKNCVLMKKILDDLLVREQDKFLKALRIKAPKVFDIVEEKLLYKENEQMYRLFGMLLLNDSNLFVDVKKLVPIEYCDEYLETVGTQLPQHPYINTKDKNGQVAYEFTGAAFYDFVMAYSLGNDELEGFVNDYFTEHGKYCPSQMLIEFYEIFTESKIKGRHIPLMYNSFKAHAQLGDKVLLRIHGSIDDCYVEFELIRDEKTILFLEFEMIDLEEGIFLDQLSNCYIDVEGKVTIGDSLGEARIDNSYISCDELCWNSEQILIEAYSPGESSILSKKMICATTTLPRFEIKTDNKKNLSVSAPEVKNYYKLVPYAVEEFNMGKGDDFEAFATVVRRILSCLRSHSKDTPARKMDFIDNKIISINDYKKKVLSFLLDRGILYTDEQDWLYKLDTNKLVIYAMRWHDIREGDLVSLLELHKEFTKYMEKQKV